MKWRLLAARCSLLFQTWSVSGTAASTGVASRATSATVTAAGAASDATKVGEHGIVFSGKNYSRA